MPSFSSRESIAFSNKLKRTPLKPADSGPLRTRCRPERSPGGFRQSPKRIFWRTLVDPSGLHKSANPQRSRCGLVKGPPRTSLLIRRGIVRRGIVRHSPWRNFTSPQRNSPQRTTPLGLWQNSVRGGLFRGGMFRTHSGGP